MKKRKKFKLFAGLMLLVTMCVFSFTFADVGNINRYDSGSSSSSSFGGSGYSSYDYDSTSSSSGHGEFSTVGIIIIIIGFILFIYKYHTASKNGTIQKWSIMDEIKRSHTSTNAYINTNTKWIAEKIRLTDPKFSEENFLSWAKDVFIKLQSAWTARDWKMIRPFESNELFEQHNAQLQEYINNNKINVIERLSVESADLIGYRVDGDKEVIEVYLRAVMKDYIIDATTKNVLEGNKDTDWHMKYKLTFARKNGVKTQAGTSNKSTTNCPNCGAPTDITSAGQCEYCGSVITTGEHDWVLIGLEGIK